MVTPGHPPKMIGNQVLSYYLHFSRLRRLLRFYHSLWMLANPKKIPNVELQMFPGLQPFYP